VLVATAGSDVAGYITCPLDNEAATGEIGLLAVGPEHRRQRAGESLVRHSLSWFASLGVDRVHVVTQGGNLQALRLYERCGFAVADISLWFHKWYHSSSRPDQPGRFA
jgi:dTDP-4-amino-4,6-dideoxy-D-galactose acyltransferase